MELNRTEERPGTRPHVIPLHFRSVNPDSRSLTRNEIKFRVAFRN